jgi:hypothetical protein
MNKRQLYQILKGVVLFIFGLLDLILIIRILLKLIGASTISTFVNFWYNLSNSVFSPFKGTVKDLSSGNIVIELNSILAILIWAVFAIFLIRIIEGMFKEKINDKIRSLVDSLFKIIESILGLRLFFKLVGAGKSTFIIMLYGISSPFYEPFKGILPAFGQGNIIFETSTFIAIIIFIIFDFASEKLFDEMFKEKNVADGEKKEDMVKKSNQNINQVSNQEQTNTNTNAQNTTSQQFEKPTQQGNQQKKFNNNQNP